MLDDSNKVVALVDPVVHKGSEQGGPYPYRWDDVVAPASRLGIFEYQVEIGVGKRWFKCDGFRPEKVPLRSGERRSILVVDMAGTRGIRLVTTAWTTTPDELIGIDRKQLLPYLECSIPEVRESAFDAMAHLSP